MLHGPAELLPISSSGHTELVPWLLDWSYADLDGELRKSFEVALHAGTAAALLLALRDEVGEAVTGFDARTAGLIARSFVPPAIVGRRVLNLHPLAIFLGIAFWSWLWGPVGAFLATPILIMGRVALAHLYPNQKTELPG